MVVDFAGADECAARRHRIRAQAFEDYRCVHLGDAAWCLVQRDGTRAACSNAARLVRTIGGVKQRT
jgi:hypothetical protein